MFVCSNCGGNLKYDIKSQKMHCDYCDTYILPTDVEEKLSDAKLSKNDIEKMESGDYMEVSVYTCPQCGAELMSSSSDATSFCSFCGASNILSERISCELKPTKIIPFTVTKEECKKRYGDKLRKALFAPNELKDPKNINSFRGIYMPYWSYFVEQNGRANFDGKKEHREGDYRIVEHYNCSAELDNRYDGISHDASSSFDDKISESLAPFDTKKEIEFSSVYLSGFYAEVADVDEQEYGEEALLMAADSTFEDIKQYKDFKDISFERPLDSSIIKQTCSKITHIDRTMFPVWFMSYRSNEDRVVYAAVNGQTGKISADIPIDKKKYIIATLIVSLIVWILLNLVNTPSIVNILKTGIVGANAGLLIYSYVLSCLISNKNFLPDDVEEKSENIPEDKKESDNTTAESVEIKKKKTKKTENTPLLAAFVVALSIVFCIIEAYLLLAIITIIVGIVIIVQVIELSTGDNKGLLSDIILSLVTLISIVILGVNPVKDYWFYSPLLVISLCVIWCFFDVLYYYNQLMTRPLPQFKKKGGDDNA